MVVPRDVTVDNSARAKRMLYVRVYVQLLRMCAAKHVKLIETMQGIKAFKNACIELLNVMDEIVESQNKDPENQAAEASNLMVQVLLPMDIQAEAISKYCRSILCQKASFM